MALVVYSDSEGSDSEQLAKPAPKTAARPEPNLIAAGFAVNRTNPRKIQVSLGGSVAEPTRRSEDGEPAAKRAKFGGGGLGGFNAMLPLPKRDTEKKPTTNGSARKVFNLKTGAEPGFIREADAEFRQLFTEPTTIRQPDGGSQSPSSTTRAVPTTSNPMQFRPLSVARNIKKKLPSVGSLNKTSTLGANTVSTEPTQQHTTPLPNPKPSKVSLFSAGVEHTRSLIKDEAADGGEDTGQPPADLEQMKDLAFGNDYLERSAAAPPEPQSLDTIASDLNLSAADRRRLFGREGKNASATINIVNFNTDQEYAANEALRASGEQVQHNPLRGIAPGKHSLKQLVNAASTQKDALEESFAAGKSNKREAGSRYGW